MNKKNIILLSLIAIFIVLTSMGVISYHNSSKDIDLQKPLPPKNVQKKLVNIIDSAGHLKVKKAVTPVLKPVLKASGVIRDSSGKPMKGIIVSDSYTCVQTDDKGRFTIIPDSQAKFIYYTIPADCEVPTHSATDHTAYFYQKISSKKKNYNFILKKLPGGKENNFKLIVFGDPQVTNAFNPYYIDATDNPIKKSDIARFTDETMVDVKRTIARLPKGIPVYGLSMGDDVQYYGGYNATLERQIRNALGSSDMRLFSVIGNHDQDNKPLYQ